MSYTKGGRCSSAVVRVVKFHNFGIIERSRSLPRITSSYRLSRSFFYRNLHDSPKDPGSGKSTQPPNLDFAISKEQKEQLQQLKLSWPQRLKNFLFGRFLTFVQGYQNALEKRFPGAMHVYRVFLVGFKEFSKELAEYIRLKTNILIEPEVLKGLNTKELDLYYRMPIEVGRVGPTLLISALPLANYIIFPVAYYFPKRLLSSHFWSIEQKHKFAQDFHQKRLYNYRPVFRCLQAGVDDIEDENMYQLFYSVLNKLGSGSHPSVSEIIQSKPLFADKPYSLMSIHGHHVKGLCRMHRLHTLYLRRTRLFDRSEMLENMDNALRRENLHAMKVEDIRKACYLRGLNAANAPHDEMIQFLQNWMDISAEVDLMSYSLLLHLPILLSYNNPSNWALLSS